MNNINQRSSKHQLLGDWNIIKENFHFTPEEKLQLVRNGEIWWVGIGENVGIEINGKSEYFSRPVLVQVFSISRLYGRLGQVPDTDLEKVRNGFLRLYSK